MCWQTTVWVVSLWPHHCFQLEVELICWLKFFRVMVITTEGLSFSLVFLFQLPHSFSRDLSSVVQIWNFSSLSNSSPAPSCNLTKQWFLLNSFVIQTVFGISPSAFPKFHLRSNIVFSYNFGSPLISSVRFSSSSSSSLHHSLQIDIFIILWCLFYFQSSFLLPLLQCSSPSKRSNDFKLKESGCT